MLKLASSIGGMTFALLVSVFAETNFSNVVSTGSIIVGIMVAIGTVLAMSYGVKWKPTAQAATARADELEKELENERARHETCSTERKDLQQQLGEKKELVAKLEALPNLALVLEQMSKEAARIDEHSKVRLEFALQALRDEFKVHTDELIHAINDLRIGELRDRERE